MQRKLLLFLRISKPDYNKTLYNEYKLYMNAQKNFRNKKLNKGQYDKYEGAIAKGPGSLVYHAGQEVKHLDKDGIVYKESNAHIFCLYALEFDISTYDEKNNRFYHKNYGFIYGEDGNTYFIHNSKLHGEYIDRGYYVHFRTFRNDRSNYNAKDVTVIEAVERRRYGKRHK